MKQHNFSKGDKVSWQRHGNTAEGTVEEKITWARESTVSDVFSPPKSVGNRTLAGYCGA